VKGLTLAAARARVVAGAFGRVLEVGAGSGANLGWYPPTVDHLDLCEPDPKRRRRLERRLTAGRWPFSVVVHDRGAQGPFPAQEYDVVVATFVLCSAPDPGAAAAAMRAVLAPRSGGTIGPLVEGGRVHFLEHVHAGGLLGRVQSRLSPRWARVAGGCRLDQPATAALRGAGLVPVEQRWFHLPPPLGLAIEGEAIARIRPTEPKAEGGS